MPKIPKYKKDALPFVVGGDVRWGWTEDTKGAMNGLLGHWCKDNRYILTHVDISTGQNHQLISKDPIHIEPSLACRDCSFHGFIRNGQWINA